jgi:phenylalanyl-tRNA synthetase alpha subunit
MSWSDDNWVRCDASNKEANTGLTTEQAFKYAVKKETVVQKTKLQKIIRYYISSTGDKITKCHNDGREIQVEAGEWKQTVLNRVDSKIPFSQYDINLKYYLEEIYKQIEQIEKIEARSSTQLSLF